VSSIAPGSSRAVRRGDVEPGFTANSLKVLSPGATEDVVTPASLKRSGTSSISRSWRFRPAVFSAHASCGWPCWSAVTATLTSGRVPLARLVASLLLSPSWPLPSSLPRRFMCHASSRFLRFHATKTQPSTQSAETMPAIIGAGLSSGVTDEEGVLLELPASEDAATSVTPATVMPRAPSAELRFSVVTSLANDPAWSAGTVTAVVTSTETPSSLLRVATSTTDTMRTADSATPNATATPAM